MRTIQSVDFLIWKYIVPRFRPEIFKSKLVSLMAVLYISFYNWPRKFLWHYFTGKGKPLTVETKCIITGNSSVFNMVISEINHAKKQGKKSGDMYVGQVHVNNPNYKYSVGSFNVTYSLDEESVSIRVNSDYRFTQNNSRITKHLHNWLYSYKQKGYVHNFNIEGDEWKLKFSELSTTKIDAHFKKYDFLNMMYV